MTRLKRRLISLFVVAGIGVWGVTSRPSDSGGSYAPAFAQWNQALKASQPGRPVALIDLDALDHNAALIHKRLGDRYALRLVTKSIPSLPLISYLMDATGSRRLMAFTEALLGELLQSYGDSTDILLGKPLPVEAAARLLEAHPSASQVQWLIDTRERCVAYLELSRRLNRPLKVSLEIDVGLHRGGARTKAELESMLAVIKESQGQLELTGLMGYDGHVPHIPAFLAPPTFQKDKAIQSAFRAVLEQYADFVSAGKSYWPEAFSRPLIFDSGGSHTYPLYPDVQKTSINDLSIGSAFLAPGNFAELGTLGHRPALYLATPVLKHLAPGDVPFLDAASSLLSQWDINLTQGYGLMGGGWTASPVQPPGLTSHFLLESGGGVESLLSNQRVLYASPRVSLEVGDFVFFHPWEGDAMLTFDVIYGIRGGRIVERWPTFRGGSG